MSYCQGCHQNVIDFDPYASRFCSNCMDAAFDDQRCNDAAMARAEAAEAKWSKLRERICKKKAQVENYRDYQCQRDHAKAFAEGRVAQCRQVLMWFDEADEMLSPTEQQR